MINSLPERFKWPFVISASNPIFLALVAISLLAFVLPLALTEQRFPTAPINFEEIRFPSDAWQDRLAQMMNEASLEKDATKRFEINKQIFEDLMTFYRLDSHPGARRQVEILAKFLTSEFPESVHTVNLEVPCLDLECGIANYPNEIEKIKTELADIASLSPQVWESIMKNFEQAALSSKPNSQWFSYLAAFGELKDEKERTDDEKLGEIALELKEFLRANYPEIYSRWEEEFPESLQI